MKLKGIFIILAILVAGSAVDAAQQAGTDIVIGKKITMRSAVLSENRDILIYTPADYDKNKDRHPVLYVLDGEDNFHYASGVVRFRAMYRVSPDMIVVGIVNTDRNRDMTPTRAKTDFRGREAAWLKTTGGADNLLRFLETEVIPIVDKNYRTQPFRILTGHSFGGLFVMHAFLSRPELFNAFISVSASFWYDEEVLLKRAEAKLAALNYKDKTLYFSVGGKEHELQVGNNQQFARLLREKTPQGLRWKFEYLALDSHGSQALRALYNGLEFVYENWQAPPPPPQK
jgi:uncharacterized protein